MALEPVIERVGSLEEARPGWTELAVASANPFLTWEWAEAWWRTFGAGRELAIHRLRDADGRLIAILPLYRARRGPLSVLRFLGHGPADELGPVCAPEHAAVALRALAEIGAGLPRRCVLLADRLPAADARALVPAGRVVRAEATPVLPIGGRSWEEWLAGRSSNFRGQVRRLERRLVRDHGLAFRVTDDRARLAADLDALVRLHAARWAGTGTGTVAFAGRRLAFHRTFAERALEQGWLRLWLAEVDGRAIAAMYCLRIGDCDWYYQAGRDPAWDRHRVGFVLLARTIRAAFDDGMRAYRFGLGDEAYKARFAETDPGLRTVLLGDRLVTGLGAAAAAAARRLPAQARRAIGRIAA